MPLGPQVLLSDVLPEVVPDGDEALEPVGPDDEVGLGALESVSLWRWRS